MVAARAWGWLTRIRMGGKRTIDAPDEARVVAT
jgi:hypothetical protein